MSTAWLRIEQAFVEGAGDRGPWSTRRWKRWWLQLHVYIQVSICIFRLASLQHNIILVGAGMLLLFSLRGLCMGLMLLCEYVPGGTTLGLHNFGACCSQTTFAMLGCLTVTHTGHHRAIRLQSRAWQLVPTSRSKSTKLDFTTT